MDFRLTPEQQDLRTGMRELLAARFPRERLREVVDGQAPGPGPDRALWRELGEAGLFALRLPERDGGVGLGLPEAVLLFEEAGRALLPGPLVATHLAAGLVAGAAEGTGMVTAVDRPGVVEHLATADAVLLLDGERARLWETGYGAGPDALSASPLRSVDPATPLHLLDALPGTVQGIQQVGAAAPLRREAVLLTAAQQLGSAARTMEMAVAHAKARTQFGRPIGAFQAVQHLCADMLVRTELARTSVYAASLTVMEKEVAGAKLLADEAAVRNARDCLQLHGGLGFAWESDVHPHLKRAWLRAAQWQSAAEAEEEIADGLQVLPADFGGLPGGGRGNSLGRNHER